MIPAVFDYVRASSVDDAVAKLRDGGEDAKVLAGGQSLIPLLRLRLAAPALLVDLTGIADMRGVREDGSDIVVGAMTTHDAVLKDPLVAQYASLIAKATATVADRQVRHRGTFGGSLAHADPAGDLPAVAVALDATFVIAGPGGRRSVPASAFFQDYLTTALAADELLVSVRVPKRDNTWGTHYEKFSRTAQAWAIVGVATAVRRDGGSIVEASVALTNMGSTPIRASAVEAALIGAASPESIASAAAHAAEGTRPTGDVTASAEFRRHLAAVLTRRAVLAASAG